MYTAIPGFAHLKLYVPEDRVVYSRPSHVTDVRTRKIATRLVSLAVDVAAGQRAITHLPHKHFHPTIKLHLGTWIRAHELKRKREAKVRSIHIRPNGEIFGTAGIGSAQHAFTGSIEGEKLVSFRLL
ncbi:hypothetical protein [Corynebacterium endometrii]|uniref:Uncharacterized protein n=1 Tax=Corynebacterium endometrii TaxID=2488819 RepID=A0A4P7QE78_9CORY|nr:hypothetical protein [Corynebacterium endometrii]QCB27885.1 hypothetical protein CENDO_02935 [Corynebacterium endometrii]